MRTHGIPKKIQFPARHHQSQLTKDNTVPHLKQYPKKIPFPKTISYTARHHQAQPQTAILPLPSTYSLLITLQRFVVRHVSEGSNSDWGVPHVHLRHVLLRVRNRCGDNHLQSHPTQRRDEECVATPEVADHGDTDGAEAAAPPGSGPGLLLLTQTGLRDGTSILVHSSYNGGAILSEGKSQRTRQ